MKSQVVGRTKPDQSLRQCQRDLQLVGVDIDIIDGDFIDANVKGDVAAFGDVLGGRGRDHRRVVDDRDVDVFAGNQTGRTVAVVHVHANLPGVGGRSVGYVVVGDVASKRLGGDRRGRRIQRDDQWCGAVGAAGECSDFDVLVAN